MSPHGSPFASGVVDPLHYEFLLQLAKKAMAAYPTLTYTLLREEELAA